VRVKVLNEPPVTVVVVTLCTGCGAVYCNRSCLWVGWWVWLCVIVWVGGWVCYHDNLKLRASILTKLGL